MFEAFFITYKEYKFFYISQKKTMGLWVLAKFIEIF